MTDRDANGRFIKGHAKTGGRSTRPVEEQYKESFSRKITPEKLDQLIDVLYNMALKKDINAIKIILEYILGKPIQRNEHTGADGGPLSIVITERQSEAHD